jgi:hypothetical protein
VFVGRIAEHPGVTRGSIHRKNQTAHRAGRLWRFKVSKVDQWAR